MLRQRSIIFILFALLAAALPAYARQTEAAGMPIQALAEHPSLELGSSGPDVTELQNLLNNWIAAHPEAGLDQLPVTGYFGPLTQGAVIAFQQAHGLPAAGLVGPLTWAALLGTGDGTAPAAPPPPPPPVPCRNTTARGLMIPRGVLTCRPWMVMIDNHPDAYPQSGLDKAAVVFEGLAEYGITRYIATYADGWTPDAAEIGPIRSTRSYFAQWAMGFHPVYVHAGGSPDGQSLVQSTDQLINFEALINEGVYAYRDQSRYAPHNLYTNPALLRQYARDKGVTNFSDPGVGYLYADPAPLAQPQATAIDYYYLDAGSAAGFVYDSATNLYYRHIFGQIHRDRITGAQIRTSNVVVMAVNGARRPGDAKARVDQYVIGNGPAQIFKDGGVINATWVKNSSAGPLRFYDNVTGNEVVFSAGAIWIAAIPGLDRLTVR